MKVLLVHPPLGNYQLTHREQFFPSIGLGYLSACLQQKGHEVLIADSYVQAALNEGAHPKSFAQLVDHLIVQENPSIIGITCISHTRKTSLDIARLAKIRNSQIVVVMGGPHASLQYKQLLSSNHECVDYVVRGEGEKAIGELLEAIQAGKRYPNINGVSFVKKHEVKQTGFAPMNSDINSIPVPDYSYHASVSHRECIPTIGLITTRGCPYHCRFCVTPTYCGRYVRARSPGNILDELQNHQFRYGTRSFKFHDDCFTLDRGRAIKIFHGILRNKIEAEFYMHTRIELIDGDLLKAFKKAGGKCVYYGLESGSWRLRKTMGKGDADPEILVDVSRAMKRLGLSMGVFVLLGYPGETPEDVYDTYELLQRIQPDDIFVSSAKIQPGTALAEIAKRMGIHRDEDWLDEDRKHFTFALGEQKAFVDGCILLFDEMYRRQPLRSDFENNYEANNIRQSGADYEALKTFALQEIKKVEAKKRSGRKTTEKMTLKRKASFSAQSNAVTSAKWPSGECHFKFRGLNSGKFQNSGEFRG